jgi:predicted extracellular nuclease
MLQSRPSAALLSLALVITSLVALPATAQSTDAAPVVVNEVATRGPAGATDNFIELRNVSADPVDISGWRIERCTGTGNAALQVTVADHVLAPGDHFLAAHPDFSGEATPDVTYGTSLADNGGARIVDAAGTVVDGVGFSTVDGHACTQGTALAPLTTTQGTNGLAYTRDADGTNTGDNAADFTRQARTPTASTGSADPTDPDPTDPDPTDPGDLLSPVVVNEIATRGPGGAADEFVELRNVSDAPVDISGWQMQGCNSTGAVGTRATVDQHVMAPGDHYLLAHSTGFTGEATPDATYGVGITDTGGARILDATGTIVDGVGFSSADTNLCTRGEPVPSPLTSGVDAQALAHTRDAAGTNTGDNATDFVRAARTPTGSSGTVDPEPPGEVEGVGAIVISEVYGGGNNSGAPLSHDFVELFNRGDETITFTNWSVQYASAAAGNWSATPVSGTLEPGQYFLVQFAGGTSQGAPGLPTPDATGTSNLAAGSGKVALVAGTTPLSCAEFCVPDPLVSDFVGYGLLASSWEGSAPTDQLSNSTSASRLDEGCIDTDDNFGDFSVGDPAPRNTSVTREPCPDTAPRVLNTTPADGDTRIDPASDVTITFSEPVTVAEDWYAFSCDGSDIEVAQAGGPRNYRLDPVADLAADADCTVTVVADRVVDQDHDPLTMEADHTFTFTVDDGSQIRIAEIQGDGHLTPFLGRTVSTVPGVVTARVGNGFYLQDPAPEHDDRRRSDGIFVFTGSGAFSHIAPGDEVAVTGTASEFRAGGPTSANLSVTQIAGTAVEVTSTGNELPDPVVIGEAGVLPPTEVIHPGTEARDIERDPASFDPDAHGVDFYETLEGMLVQVDDPQAVGPTDGGEIAVVGDRGDHATGMTERGGIIVSPDDFNPERIHLSDWLSGVTMPDVHVGDYVDGSVVGVLDYSGSNYKVRLTESPTFEDGGLERGVGTAVASETQLSISSFNVENLHPGREHFDRLADKVVNHLQAPDLLNLVEIQDNDGPANTGTTDASDTYAALIAAIEEAGGPSYEFRDIAPENNQDGGQTGGNIRVGFLFRTDRGLDFVDRPGGDATTPVEVVDGEGGPALSVSPGRIAPQDPAWTNGRKPLVGEFTFNGERLFVVGTHFLAKIADEPLFGRYQLPERHTEVRRVEQARLVNEFVQDLLAQDPDANVAVLGDMNDFHFSSTNDVLEADGALTNLMDTLPTNERYSYIFQGNSQDLDQFMVSPALYERYFESFEVVPIASEFHDQVTDHDPNLAIFDVVDEPAPEPETGNRAVFADVRDNIQAGQPVNLRFEILDPDGDRVPFEEVGVTLRAPDGTTTPLTSETNPSGWFWTSLRTELDGIHTVLVRTPDGALLGRIDITVEPRRGNRS